MTKFENKIQILHDLYIYYGGDEEFSDFVEVHDLGIPLAVVVTQGLAIMTEAGAAYIDSDFRELCLEIGVDEHGDYDSLEEMFLLEGPNEQG